jgi:hypothetical protein
MWKCDRNLFIKVSVKMSRSFILHHSTADLRSDLELLPV